MSIQSANLSNEKGKYAQIRFDGCGSARSRIRKNFDLRNVPCTLSFPILRITYCHRKKSAPFIIAAHIRRAGKQTCAALVNYIHCSLLTFSQTHRQNCRAKSQSKHESAGISSGRSLAFFAFCSAAIRQYDKKEFCRISRSY